MREEIISMPVYKLGPTASGGYRSILPPDPEEKSKVGAVLACAVAAMVGLGGCVMICAVLDDKATDQTLDLD
jgi:hypothetical protein